MNEENFAGDLVLFDGATEQVGLRMAEAGDTLWGTRQQVAALFGCSERNVNLHIQNIYADGELDPAATQQKSFLVQNEGGRQVKRPVDLVNLDVMLSVGYRVNSQAATRFRQKATAVLKSFLVNGYAINEKRLAQNPDAQQELAERLRQLRHDEKAMYAKVREVFATSATDYDGHSQQAKTFFAMAQDKFLYAVTEKTAAQIILDRADASKLNMGLRSINGEQPTKEESKIGKNYLSDAEVRSLENICEQFLLFAESKAFRGQKMTMEEITEKLNTLLRANDYEVLYKYDRYQRQQAETHARLELERYRARIGPAKPQKQIAETETKPKH